MSKGLVYLWCLVRTAEEGGEGEGDADDGTGDGSLLGGSGDDGGDDGGSGDGAGGEDPDGAAGDGDDPWFSTLGLTDEQKESIKDLSLEDALGKITAEAPGVPEKYTVPESIKVEEGSAVEQKVNAFRETAKGLGLTQDQFNGLAEKYIHDTPASYEEAVKQSIAEQNSTGLREMQESLGADKFMGEVDSAKQVVMALGDQDFNKFLNETDLGSSPMLIKQFAKIGKFLGEDSIALLKKGVGSMPPKHPAHGTDAAVAKKMYPTMN